MKNIIKTIIIYGLFSVLYSPSGYAQVPAADSLALVKLYNTAGGDSWFNKTNWKTSANVGDWYGVNVSGGRVFQVELGSNNLTGQLPVEIGDLTALERLDVAGNTLSGNIPGSIGNLINLNYLNVSWNDYTDASFPGELNQLVNLEILNLYRCNLSAIPMSVFELTKLTGLYLGYNQITSVPVELENLSLLQTLYLGTNQLGGVAPPQLFKLSNLTSLDLSQNGFTEIPDFITNMTWLTYLNMSGNSLDDLDMANIGNLTNLETLYLTNNLLTSITDEITSISSLRNLYLSSNQIPNSAMGNLAQLSELVFLGLSGNLLNAFPSEIWTFSNLRLLDLGFNHIYGEIPADFSSLPNLETLYLNSNFLTGNVPQEIADLSKLVRLNIDDNELEGLPIFNTTNGFQWIYANNNRLTFEDIVPNLGVAPIFTYSPQDEVGSGMDTVLTMGESITLNVDVGGADNLYQWFKDEMELTGEKGNSLVVQMDMPQKFGTYKVRITNSQATDLTLWSKPFNLTQDNLIEQDSLALVAMYNLLNGNNWNRKNGWLSSPLSNWEGVVVENNRVVELNLSANNLIGGLPVQIGDLTALKVLQLNNNSLSGWIPDEILNCSQLESVYLQVNQLDSLPDFHALSHLKILNIEENNFLFEDIEPNMGAAGTVFTYAPQDSIQLNPNWFGRYGDELVIEVPTKSPNNSYQWFKNGNNLGQNVNPLILGFLSDLDMGYYTCLITNTLVPGLTLQTTLSRVKIEDAPFVQYRTDFPTLPRSAIIQFDVKPNGLPTSISINYGKTTALGQHLNLVGPTFQDNDVIAAEIFVPDLDPDQDYHYTITGSNSAGSFTTTDRIFRTQSYPAFYTFSDHVNLPEHGKASDYEVYDYRLFGLPGSSDFPVGDLFDGKIDEDWVVYWDNGTPTDYYQKYDPSADFICTTGRAFWVLSLHGIDINRDINRAPLNGFSEAEISLHSGWNLITNPFDQMVAWSDIEAVNDDLAGSQLFDFQSTFNNSGQLNPFEGYLFNPPQNMTHLKIPYPGGGSNAALNKSAASAEMKWEINLILESDGFTDATTRFGVCNDLVEDQIVNHKKPRAMGEFLNIYFEHPEWDALEPAYVTDFRSIDAENQSWEVTTQLLSGKKASLSAQGIELVPEDLDIYLIQRESGKYWNLRKQNTVSFIPSKVEQKFEIVVGVNEFIEDVLATVLPKTYSLDQNYPNPFNPTTTISYTVPPLRGPSGHRTGDRGELSVTLSVYNALGQKVYTLVNQSQEAGNYSVGFDGSNLASGVYYYRLATSEFSQTRKMILIR